MPSTEYAGVESEPSSKSEELAVPDESTVLRSGRLSVSSMMDEITGDRRVVVFSRLIVFAGEVPLAEEGDRERSPAARNVGLAAVEIECLAETSTAEDCSVDVGETP